jgi:hypothetical protein
MREPESLIQKLVILLPLASTRFLLRNPGTQNVIARRVWKRGLRE